MKTQNAKVETVFTNIYKSQKLLEYTYHRERQSRQKKHPPFVVITAQYGQQESNEIGSIMEKLITAW